MRKISALIRLDVFILFSITLICTIPRVIFLDKIPPGLQGDEAWMGIEALRILKEGYIGPYTGAALGNPSGPYYFTALIFKFFGDSILTLRLSMAIFGVITVPVFYLFLRQYFSKFPSTLGTLFFGMSYYHIFYSRIAFPVISAQIFVILTLIFLKSEYSKKNYINIAIAGIFCGLGVYSYNAYIFFPIAVFLFLFSKIITSSFSIIHIKRLAIFSVIFLISSSQLINFYADYGDSYLSHFNLIISPYQNKNVELDQKINMFLITGASNTTSFFTGNFQDSGDGFGTERPIGQIVLLLFAIGTLILIIKIIKERKLIYLFFVFTFLFLFLLTALGSPSSDGIYRRQVISVIFIFLFLAFAISYLTGIKNKLFRKTFIILLVLLLFLNSFENLKIYFTEFPKNYTAKYAYSYELVSISSLLNSQPKPIYVYFYSDRWSYNYETLRFLLQNIQGTDRSERFGEYSLKNNHPDSNVVYIFLPEYLNSIIRVKEQYPNGKEVTLKDEYGSILFTSYFVPKKLNAK